MNIMPAEIAQETVRTDGKTIADFGVKALDITLIRPTNYTDDGYPIKTRVGVIRSNTLTQMGTLTRDLSTYPFFKDVPIDIHKFDEAIDWVPTEEIIQRSQTPGTKSIVMMVGVQSNQYPRALDLASRFLPHGIPVLIGGFHVSGMLSMIGLTKDLEEAMARGITLVAGEVENGRLPSVVEDVVRGEAKQLYNFLNPTPSLEQLPTPRITEDEFRNFASRFTTIDTGRGCVFTCDFCTIINVQGRTMRFRDPNQVVDFVRQSYLDAGVKQCFFTDDNIARNPRWRELFEGLIHLREVEKIPFHFMMQSDLAARKLPGGDFFVLAARAGCYQVFFGVESVNRENLRSKEKFQNQVAEYKDLVAHCHEHGITCQAGYIVGLPFDTPASLKEDIAELQRMMFDAASFYVLSPLPGSKDHQRWTREGRWMDPDFNTYDSAHVAVAPERMTPRELWDSYRNTWEQFYTIDHMVNVLKGWRNNALLYWDRMAFFMWYLYASRIERLHPMNCGFWTVRKRTDRRPGFPIEGVIPFWWGQFTRTMRRVGGIVRLFFQLQEVWLRSRPKTEIEEALQDLLSKTRTGVTDWRVLKSKELASLYQRLHSNMPHVRVPHVAVLWFRKHNPFVKAQSRAYANRIWKRWYLYVWNPLQWIEVWLFEWVNGMAFLARLLGGTR